MIVTPKEIDEALVRLESALQSLAVGDSGTESLKA